MSPESLAQCIQELMPSIQRGFDEYQSQHFIQRSGEFFALELCGEAGELANLVKKQWKGLQIENGRLGEEAADVCIALFNYCNAAGINLASAVADKVKKIPPSK